MSSYLRNFLTLEVNGYYDESAQDILVVDLPEDFPEGEFTGIPFVWYNKTNFSMPSGDPLVEFVLVTGRTGKTLHLQRAQQGTLATKKDTINKRYVLELVISVYHFEELREEIAAAIELDHSHANLAVLNQMDTPFTAALKAIYDEGLTTARNPLPHTQGSDTILNESKLIGDNLTEVFDTINDNGIDIKDLQIAAKNGGAVINQFETAVIDQVEITEMLLTKWFVHIIDQYRNTRQSLEVLAHYNGADADYTAFAIVGESETDITVDRSGNYMRLKATAKEDGQSVYVLRNSIKLV